MPNSFGGRSPSDNSQADRFHATSGEQAAADPSSISVIGVDIVIVGNIEASVDLHIEGKVVGDVRCATLILGESSSIEGRINAQRVRVSGTVTGSVDTGDLALEATARVAADVGYERLKVANGASLEGSLRRKPIEEGTDASKLKLVAPAADAQPAAASIE